MGQKKSIPYDLKYELSSLMNTTKQTNRWLLMVFGMICMLVMGICYTYNLFQPHVMTHFGVDSAGRSPACFSPIAADRFGTKNLGTILSVTMIGFGTGSVGVSLLAKMVGTCTAFICAGAVAPIGILLVLTLLSVKKA